MEASKVRIKLSQSGSCLFGIKEYIHIIHITGIILPGLYYIIVVLIIKKCGISINISQAIKNSVNHWYYKRYCYIVMRLDI